MQYGIDALIIVNGKDKTDLIFLLYGILQRYYTTPDGREKRIASAIRKL